MKTVWTAALVGLVLGMTPVMAAKVEKKATSAPTAAPASTPSTTAAVSDFNADVSQALGLRLGLGLQAQSQDSALRQDVIIQALREALSKDQVWLENYMLGLQQGMQMSALQKEGVAKIDIKAFESAFQMGLKGDTSIQGKAQATMQELQQRMMQLAQKKQNEVADKNLREGVAFLATNKTQPGVKELAGGLQYKVLKEGTGAQPALGDSVKVHYTGKLLSGQTFDSSVDRGQPVTFALVEGGLIKGWTDLLPNLKAGTKVQAWIPDNLAYGDRGAGEQIGPKTTLQFEIELIEVIKAAPKAAAPVKKK
jgi:FKBP-type peptidyl-prolyl cis-trans isomerase FklB